MSLEKLGEDFIVWLTSQDKRDIGRFARTAGFAKQHPTDKIRIDHFNDRGWLTEPTDNPEIFRFKDPETGMYFETDHIPKYLRDCTVRQDCIYTKDILDKECIHKDTPQKLFFVVPTLGKDMVPELTRALKEWILSEYEKEPEIVLGTHKESIIVICTNIIVSNYEQKKEIIERFSKTLSIGLQYLLRPYLNSEVDVFETLPSVTNKDYETTFIVDLLDNEYIPDSGTDTLEQLMKFLPTNLNLTAGNNIVINIIINNINNTNNYAGGISQYRAFVEHIQKDKPDWYHPGEWLPKHILVEKYNERNGTDVSLRTLMRNFRSEDLMKEISGEEKRMRIAGKQTRVFLAK